MRNRVEVESNEEKKKENEKKEEQKRVVLCSYWFLLKTVVKTKAKDINNNLMKTATVRNSCGIFCMLNSRRNEFLMKIAIKIKCKNTKRKAK